MLTSPEFERWIEASHALFEVFEGRYDAHPLAHIWTQEWLSSGDFRVEEDYIRRLSNLKENFNYEVLM